MIFGFNFLNLQKHPEDLKDSKTKSTCQQLGGEIRWSWPCQGMQKGKMWSQKERHSETEKASDASLGCSWGCAFWSQLQSVWRWVSSDTAILKSSGGNSKTGSWVTSAAHRWGFLLLVQGWAGPLWGSLHAPNTSNIITELPFLELYCVLGTMLTSHQPVFLC